MLGAIILALNIIVWDHHRPGGKLKAATMMLNHADETGSIRLGILLRECAFELDRRRRRHQEPVKWTIREFRLALFWVLGAWPQRSRHNRSGWRAIAYLASEKRATLWIYCALLCQWICGWKANLSRDPFWATCFRCSGRLTWTKQKTIRQLNATKRALAFEFKLLLLVLMNWKCCIWIKLLDERVCCNKSLLPLVKG